MKISLIGSHNLADGYLGASKALARLGYDIEFIPARRYYDTYYSNPEKHVLQIIEDLKSQKPDFVLWWRAETLSDVQLKRIKDIIKKPFIMYSWDDPLQWETHSEMPQKCKIFDIAFTCCLDSMFQYKDNGCESFYIPPGFDPEVHYPDYDEKYACDISLVCTNLYESPHITKYAHINRKTLIKQIIDNFPEINLKVYGLEYFGQIFPKHYGGWISFNESRKVYSSSKINISTHIRPDGNGYINERVSQILGSKGLLLIDNVKGLKNVLNTDNECLIMDYNCIEEFVQQIKNTLDNYDNYKHVIENGYNRAINHLTWDCWAKKIICKTKEIL